MGRARRKGENIAPRLGLAKRATGLLAAGFLALASAFVTVHAAAQAPLSDRDTQIYARAFEAAERGAWDDARALARQAEDPLPAKVIHWLDLGRADTPFSFQEIAGFITQNPSWPGLGALRLQAERTMPPGLPADQVAAWFDAYPPQTFDAVMRYASALRAIGREGDALAFIRDRWVSIPVTSTQQQRLLAEYGAALGAEEHWARLDNLLWAGRADEARRMFPLVDEGRRALAEARLKLAGQETGVDAALARVPAHLAGDEGLVYERVRWRRRADRTDGAIELLSGQPQVVSRPSAWWTERSILARRLFNSGDYAGAYAVASGHRQDDPSTLSEAEWLAGWIALRYLGDPARAIDHFARMYEVVGTPISLARGAYWLGRSYAALGEAAEAERWYRVAAQYDTVFYGQLAAGELGLPTVTSLSGSPSVPQEARVAFAGLELVQIARMLHQIGDLARAEQFLQRLASVQDDPITLTLVGDLALDLQLHHIAVRVGKQAVRGGLTLVDASFPVHAFETSDRRADPALVLALIRQESEFNTRAVSRAGARGLMQLMPATADSLASRMGVDHSTSRLTDDARHNVLLGSTYLANQIERFRGSYVLAVAGYNAGPNRVAGWLETMGDPRGGAMDLYQVIDWIEAIPLSETRNYVQRVLENTQVYRMRLGGSPELGGLERDLMR